VGHEINPLRNRTQGFQSVKREPVKDSVNSVYLIVYSRKSNNVDWLKRGHVS